MMQDEQGGGSKDKTVWAHSFLSQWSERLDPRSPMNAHYSHKYLRLDSQWQIFKVHCDVDLTNQLTRTLYGSP